jgi:hypothetical protein
VAIDILPDLGLGKKQEAGKLIYQAGNQHVSIVRQESDAGNKPPANDHPIEFTAEQLATVLHSLTLQHVGGIIVEKEEVRPLFSDREVSALAPNIARALTRAQPNEDVTFLVAGTHGGMMGKEQAATTGRVFYTGGRLNLIFGDVYKPMADKSARDRALAAGCGDCQTDDRAVFFNDASRYRAGDLPEPLSTIAGVDYGREGNKVRRDWLVIDVDTIVASVEKQRNRLPPALEKERREAKMEAARAAVERRQMREEMARMRKEMQNGGGTTAAAPQTIEERIATLDKLKKKGLISPEEYDTRRQEILNDI